MINSNTIALKVNNTAPARFKTNVDVNTSIEITFNSELDTSSIMSNLFIFEDENIKYNEGALNVNEYVSIDGNITYKDKSITFTPKVQLKANAQCIIYMPKNGIRDIFGKVIPVDFISTFTTETYQSLGSCNIVIPESNKTLNILNKIELEDLSSDKYLIQISKIKTFDNIVYEEVFDTNIIEKDFKLGDGLYYIRAKALNGSFGEVCVLSIKTHENTIPTDQDLDEDYIWEEYVEEEHGLIESFPQNNLDNINEKTNVVYMKFKGIIDVNEVDYYESFMNGEPSDDDTDIKPHGEIDGVYTLVVDDTALESYMFFMPNSL